MNEKLTGVLQDGKFWAAVVALVLAFFGERGGVEGTELVAGVATCVSYILGVSLKDGLEALAEGVRYSK